MSQMMMRTAKKKNCRGGHKSVAVKEGLHNTLAALILRSDIKKMETGFDYKIRTTVSTDKFSNERNSNYLIYFCAQKSYFLNIFIMVIVFIQYLTKYSNSWQ